MYRRRHLHGLRHHIQETKLRNYTIYTPANTKTCRAVFQISGIFLENFQCLGYFFNFISSNG